MYFLIVAAILVAVGPEQSDYLLGSYYDPALTIMLIMLAVMAAPVPGFFIAASLRRALRSGNLSPRWRRIHRSIYLYYFFLLADFALLSYLFGWSWFVDDTLGLRGAVLLDELLKLLPFLCMLLLALVPLYRIEITVRRASWSLAQYIEFILRQYVLFLLVPFSILVVAVDLWMRLPRDTTEYLFSSGLFFVIAPTFFGTFYLLMPLLLRHIWRTEPLPPGPLRQSLTQLCSRARVGCRTILIWHTLGGQILNACVVGLLRPVRLILLTDSLLSTLTPDEITAVFAHELAHARRHHLFFYVLFALAFLLTLTGHPAQSFLHSGQVLLGLHGPLAFLVSVPVIVVLVAVYWGLLFGFLSRRLELEADLVATRLVGGRFDFINALEKISAASGRPRDAHSWRHFSVARRVRFLLDVPDDPRLLRSFHLSTVLLKTACLVLVLASITFFFSGGTP